MVSERKRLLLDWLGQGLGLSNFSMEVASDDASFRRYFRITLADGNRRIAMDAPPDNEDVRPFIQVAEMLVAQGLHVPHIFARDVKNGFLLIEDFGNQHYQDVLSASTAAGLYGDAMAALAKLYPASVKLDLPTYDETLLRAEMALFHDWLIRQYLQIELSQAESDMLAEVADLLVASALEQPVVPVLRDYHCRNLLVVENNNPGIIDFQDAVNGPVTYDLVSLLKDCYVQWPREWVLQWVESFYSELQTQGVIHSVEVSQFIRWFDLMGVQRHLKASGIFARLNLRDDKAAYMKDIPRTLEYICEVGGLYPEIRPLAELIEQKVLPNL